MRPPRGFDPAHPLLEDLKRKDFVAMTPVSDGFVTAASRVDDFLETTRAGVPFLRYLCGALDVPF